MAWLGLLLSLLGALVAGGSVAARDALARQTAAWRADLRIVVLLREAPAAPDAPDGVVAAARVLPGVAAVRYLAPDDALEELKRYVGVEREALARLPANPLPARMEVTPGPEQSAEALDDLVAALERLGGVDEVHAALAWVGQAERLDLGLRAGGMGVGSLLGLGAGLALAGAGALARRAAAEETAILRLAGVPEARLWSPFLLQTTLLGGLGALAGVGILLSGSEIATEWTGGWLHATMGMDPWPALPWPWSAGLVAAGLGVGLAGGLAAGRP